MGRPEVAGDPLEPGPVTGDEHEVAPLARKAFGEGQADAGRGAGDECGGHAGTVCRSRSPAAAPQDRQYPPRAARAVLSRWLCPAYCLLVDAAVAGPRGVTRAESPAYPWVG
ncbi:hypothetical protein GCM10023168_07630 [Fodinibacter luteus]|uniref:Uncharacterized protein n=1 Tax=Fodinibacter luteus TaxID=552064 RepID=A0ABP8K398_9MICO